MSYANLFVWTDVDATCMSLIVYFDCIIFGAESNEPFVEHNCTT
jgi:hypothetical protein